MIESFDQLPLQRNEVLLCEWDPSWRFLVMAVSTTSSRVSFCLFSPADAVELTLDLGDTILHSWEILAKILTNPDCRDIVCDIGMYVNNYCRTAEYFD